MAKKTKTGIVFQVWGRDRNVVVKGKEVEEVESEE
jgi:hypothetical protein